MNKLRLIVVSLITMSAAFTVNSAVAGHHEKGETQPATVVALAVGAEGTSTLVAAVKAAGLVEVLSGEGPFTVLAPTDDAFAKLPAGALDGLLADP